MIEEQVRWLIQRDADNWSSSSWLAIIALVIVVTAAVYFLNRRRA